MTIVLTTVDDLTEALGVLAKGNNQLEEIIRAQGELLRGMDARIKLLTGLLDAHHEILIKHGLANPRPVAPLAN